MSLTYAIADLHGRFDLLTAAFDAIVKHAAERSFKIITLGDYVDRGPQSRQIIDHLMAAQEMGVSLICLKGNHEDMMAQMARLAVMFCAMKGGPIIFRASMTHARNTLRNAMTLSSRRA